MGDKEKEIKKRGEKRVGGEGKKRGVEEVGREGKKMDTEERESYQQYTLPQ